MSKKGKGVVWVCPKCGFKKKVESRRKVVPLVVKEQKPFKEEVKGGARVAVPLVRKEQKSFEDSIAVIGRKEQKLRTLPTVKVECPKCGNNLAFAWQVQTRGSDESSTQFFRCTKCEFTFREYT